MKKLYLLICLLCLLPCSVLGQGWQGLEVGGFTLRWATQPGDSLAVELTGPTTGWVAVGFDPESMMLGANMIIGYVTTETTEIRDDYGYQTFSHDADTSLGGTHDVLLDGGSETGGETEIRFTIPLNSGDQYDKQLVPGNTYTVLLAHGADGEDNFTTKHEFVTSTEIEIWALSFAGRTWAGIKAAE